MCTVHSARFKCSVQSAECNRGRRMYPPPVCCEVKEGFLVPDSESVLGRDEGYMVNYNPLPEGVPEGKAQGNS